MKHDLLRTLALTLCAAGLVSTATATRLGPSRTSQEATPAMDFDEDLTRARVEQDLMLAERTAKMLGDLQEALADWQAESEPGPSVERDAVAPPSSTDADAGDEQ